jgi:hypothetical protein
VTRQLWTANFAIIAKPSLRSLRYDHLFRSKNHRSAQQFGQFVTFFLAVPLREARRVPSPDRSGVSAYCFVFPDAATENFSKAVGRLTLCFVRNVSISPCCFRLCVTEEFSHNL